MTNGWRSTSTFENHDEIDKYLRNEFRAEHGAYLERRPTFRPEGARDERFWGPALSDGPYARDPSWPGSNYDLEEPLQRSADVSNPHSRRSREERYREFGPSRWRGSLDRERARPRPSERDHDGGRKLMAAAERFYENLYSDFAGQAHPEHRPRDLGHHRGRGPRNYVRSDERIREDVSDRLTDDRGIDASDFEITVSDREVTLSGTVSTRFEKRRAEDLAEAVSGVTHVQTNLRIRSTEPMK